MKLGGEGSLRRLLLALGASLPLAAMSMAADAAILDFTDTSAGAPGSGVTSGPVPGLPGVSYELSASGTITFNSSQDGSTCVILACDGDGLGVGDDEVSAVAVDSGESLTISFEDAGGNPVAIPIGRLFLLDLFTAVDGSEHERATVAYDGGSTDIDADPAETPDGDSGFKIFDFATPISTSFLTFTAPSLAGINDKLGVNDYAVAGVSIVPVPAALPLFGTGLGLMGLIGWWRRRRAAAV